MTVAQQQQQQQEQKEHHSSFRASINTSANTGEKKYDLFTTRRAVSILALKLTECLSLVDLCAAFDTILA